MTHSAGRTFATLAIYDEAGDYDPAQIAVVRDILHDRIDAGGWPTRDRAAPEED